MVKDRWIPNYPTNKVLHPPLDEEWEWGVANLIDWSTHDWNRELIFANFHRDDMEAIFRIPLSRRQVQDTLMWLHTKNGYYSVRSGYYI